MQILHELLSLLFVDVEQLFRLLKLQGQVLLLGLETVAGALEDVHLQFHFRVLLLRVLHFVPEQVQRVLNLLRADVVFLKLASFYGKFTLRRLKFFAFLSNFCLILGLSGLEVGNLVRSLLHSLVQHLDVFLSSAQIVQYSLVPGL